MISYKQTYSITSLVLPLEAKESLADEYRSAVSVTGQISETIEAHDDIFSFDLPDVSSAESTHGTDDPFDFDDHSSDVKQSGSTKSEDDVFADLLESTSQIEENPFAAQAPTTFGKIPAAEKTDASPSSGPGEFDLESFSWDDTPTAATPESKEAPDDFDSLFGDAKENVSK